MKIHACAAIAVSLLAGHAVLGQSGNSLLVLSKHDHTLAVVNPTTLQVTSRVPVGNDPHEVIASVDGTRAYVSNYGFGAFHTLAVVDLVNDKAIALDRSWRLARTAWTYISGRQNMVHLRGREGARALRSCDRQN